MPCSDAARHSSRERPRSRALTDPVLEAPAPPPPLFLATATYPVPSRRRCHSLPIAGSHRIRVTGTPGIVASHRNFETNFQKKPTGSLGRRRSWSPPGSRGQRVGAPVGSRRHLFLFSVSAQTFFGSSGNRQARVSPCMMQRACQFGNNLKKQLRRVSAEKFQFAFVNQADK